MKSVIFNEDEPPKREEILKSLLLDENDPRSSAYKRTLVRPEIKWLRVLMCIIIPLAAAVLLAAALRMLGCGAGVSAAVAAGALCIYAALMLRRALICAVRIYQRYAPDSVRNKCRFEPSCSEYMILAIEKYGVIKGLKKGISRIKRCNTNGGGYDYP